MANPQNQPGSAGRPNGQGGSYYSRESGPTDRPERNREAELAELLAVVENRWSVAQVRMIANDMPESCTLSDVQKFLYFCRMKDLDPLLGEVHAEMKGKDEKRKMAIVTHIEAYRKMADRTGEYDGQEEEFHHDGDGRLVSCTVRIWRKSCTRSFSVTCFLHEYMPEYESQQRTWKKLPSAMLRKVAEAACFRIAFPAAMSGCYVAEEMGRAGLEEPRYAEQPEDTPPLAAAPRPSDPAPPAPATNPAPTEPKPAPVEPPAAPPSQAAPAAPAPAATASAPSQPAATLEEMRLAFAKLEQIIGKVPLQRILRRNGYKTLDAVTDAALAAPAYQEALQFSDRVVWIRGKESILTTPIYKRILSENGVGKPEECLNMATLNGLGRSIKEALPPVQ
jgi:phage recombination protein Bet